MMQNLDLSLLEYLHQGNEPYVGMPMIADIYGPVHFIGFEPDGRICKLGWRNHEILIPIINVKIQFYQYQSRLNRGYT